MNDDLNALIHQMRMNAFETHFKFIMQLDSARSDVTSYMRGIAQRAEMHADRLHFESEVAMRQRFDSLEKRVDTLAETMAAIDQKLDRCCSNRSEATASSPLLFTQ
jgi:hypothetical protein